MVGNSASVGSVQCCGGGYIERDCAVKLLGGPGRYISIQSYAWPRPQEGPAVGKGTGWASNPF